MIDSTSSRRPPKRFSRWNYLILLLVLVSGVVYALPNLYGNDPSLVITSYHEKKPLHPSNIQEQVTAVLKDNKITYKSAGIDNKQVIVRFDDVDTQFKAYNAVSKAFPQSMEVTYLLASRSPDWLTAIGATSMQLGLDLQGGIHLQYQVDLEQALRKADDRYADNFRFILQHKDIRYLSITPSAHNKKRSTVIEFNNEGDYERAKAVLEKETPELVFSNSSHGKHALEISVPEQVQQKIKQLTMEKNISVFRSRANLLGVSEPLIQKKGENRIVVELPGVQNTENITRILGSTATLEFRLVHED